MYIIQYDPNLIWATQVVQIVNTFDTTRREFYLFLFVYISIVNVEIKYLFSLILVSLIYIAYCTMYIVHGMLNNCNIRFVH